MRTLSQGRSPILRLAATTFSQSSSPIAKSLLVQRDPAPAILVAFPFTGAFFRHRTGFCYRNWALDSGAVTAKNSGKPIRLEDYTAFAKEALASDPTLVEVYSLDVIGNWRASAKNARYMWKCGIPAVPTWHIGEPEEVLVGLAKDYPKIALGGFAGVGSKEKLRVHQEAFARVWPKKIHGFAAPDESSVLGLPYHSVDSTSWAMPAQRYRLFRSMRRKGWSRLRVPFGMVTLDGELEYFMRLEAIGRVHV